MRERLPLRIDFDEVAHPDGRVLIFHVPPRPIDTPIKFEGVYWTREGDNLVPMAEDQLRAIFAESGHDFSGDICSAAAVADLDPAAIEGFKRRWIDKATRSGNTGQARRLATLSPGQILADAEVIDGDRVTFAALILFGTRQALLRHLPQAEVVFEYRSSDASGPAQDRREYRQGFFSYYDDLWTLINLRNDKQHYEDGLFVLDVLAFSERPVREGLLNAVSHRDYQLGGSVFIRRFGRRLPLQHLPVAAALGVGGVARLGAGRHDRPTSFRGRRVRGNSGRLDFCLARAIVIGRPAAAPPWTFRGRAARPDSPPP